MRHLLKKFKGTQKYKIQLKARRNSTKTRKKRSRALVVTVKKMKD